MNKSVLIFVILIAMLFMFMYSNKPKRSIVPFMTIQEARSIIARAMI